MQYTITLLAGVPKRQQFTGSTLIVMDTGAALTLDLSVEVSGFATEDLRGVKRGFRLKGASFNGATITAPVNCTIEIIASDADLSINNTEGSTVNAQIVGTVPVSVALPLAVVNDRGAPGNPVSVVGISYTDAPAVTMTNNAPVACSAVAAVLVAANAARRGLRFTNIGADPVTVGAPGVSLTWANRCLILNAGDTWVEERSANLAWSAICDAAKTASVTVQEVLA